MRGGNARDLRRYGVGPTQHNTNLEPLVTGPRIALAELHAKQRRDGSIEREGRLRQASG